MVCNNSCNLPKNDDATDVLLLQIKRAVADLMEKTTTRLLMQDGKIAETCVYIKENLSNEIRVLLDAMQLSGELDDIITTTVLSDLKRIENIVHPIGHIRRYGAVGDGVVDDTIALKSAISDAVHHDCPLIVDDGVYLVTGDVSAKGLKTAQIDGVIVNKGFALEFGLSSTTGTGIVVRARRIDGVKITGVKNGIFDIGYCDTLHLYADGDIPDIASIAYTQFFGAYCREIILESNKDSTGIGWINENVFRIKRVENVTMRGNYPHNNNHFEHINFERGVLNLENARNNYISARCEGDITVNSSGDETQANFIEREYYYRAYFGNDMLEDDHGTVSFYPVNKLQTERMLLKIDRYNKSFPIGSLVFDVDGLFMGKNYNSIYHSNLIPIENTFALKMKSDAENFRVQLRFYDENKNLITQPVTNFSDGKMRYNGEIATWQYSISANVKDDTVVFWVGDAKYVEYNVIFGTADTLKIDYVTVKLLKYINTDINISDTLQHGVYTSVPTTGYWDRGTILYAKNPVAGASIGVVCVEGGTNPVWKNWGAVTP